MVYRIEIIHKIVHNQSDIVYVGSTFHQLKQRWAEHIKADSKHIISKSSEISIYPYFKKSGIENFQIVLIKEYVLCSENVQDKKHLSVFETLWIKKLNAINRNEPLGGLLINRYMEHYRNNHKEYLRKYFKQHYETNREEMIKNKENTSVKIKKN